MAVDDFVPEERNLKFRLIAFMFGSFCLVMEFKV
jgi:hypothetical protein